MTGFARQCADNWHQDVPGTRWFKADLHVHTVDDLPGRAKVPSEIRGDPATDENMQSYARLVLRAVVRRGVRVLGLTPHSARMDGSGDRSAVWSIVEEWNDGNDDDGQPFRDKIYAVFPGFEPSLADGKGGLHMLFLFDPEIGRDNYLRAFDLTMGQRRPWKGNTLQISDKTAVDAFEALRRFRDEESGRSGPAWNYLVLAPHIDNEKGLFGAEKGQILERFPAKEIAGLEIGDEKLPCEVLSKRPWLQQAMEEYRLACFHSSDAYSADDIGKRFTWIKLAQPRIEGLRQAFLASDSRIRIGFRRSSSGDLVEIEDAPDLTTNERPWLKSVRVCGGASFYGSNDGTPSQFDLSPDLTCIIGGSMTGKSTLLDGLRVYSDARLPTEPYVKDQVLGRAKGRFLAGSPSVTLECPGRDPTSAANEQWPAVFFAQNERQRLAVDSNAIESILSRLVAEETGPIERRAEELHSLDASLWSAAKRMDKLDEDFAEAEQALDRARRAVDELAVFAAAGIDVLHRVSAEYNRWREAVVSAQAVLADTRGVRVGDLPEERDDLPVSGPIDAESRDAMYARLSRARAHVAEVRRELGEFIEQASAAKAALGEHERVTKENVEQKLAEGGFDGAAIKEFEKLNVQAALSESREAHFHDLRQSRDDAQAEFDRLLKERHALVREQRAAFDRVVDFIYDHFGKKILAEREEDAKRGPLDSFITDLRQKGITRWWNDLDETNRPNAEKILDKLRGGTLAEIGMSGAVQQTFCNVMTVAKQRILATVRCGDRYTLKSQLEDDTYRRLDDLSGGQRVSILLSLLLETNDNSPLVIDQPEDELDKRFLFDRVLPALKQLKGRRQVIVATHDANIVVNGDADQVIQLEATANKGRVACAGAIERADVRDPIVRTVDGGSEAFGLRRMKYGF